MLVTLVVAKEDCFQKPFKTIKAVRISKFIWQRVPDCRASIIKSPAAVRAKLTAKHSETVQVSRMQTTTARSSIRGWDEVICQVPRCPSVQTPVHRTPSLHSILSGTSSQWSSSCSTVFSPRSNFTIKPLREFTQFRTVTGSREALDQTNQLGLLTCIHHHHLITTQTKRRYSFYRPTKGRKLS